MTDSIKKFIEDNISLIEEDRWEEVYQKAANDLGEDTGKFTEIILEADMHPELYLNNLPMYFLYKSTIEEFTIPNNIIKIISSAFEDCTKLTNVIIPNGVTSIGFRAFFYCKSLINVTIGDDVIEIGNSAFHLCTSLSDVTIGNSVVRIGNKAFDNCSSLRRIIIPNNATRIDDGAFANCGDNLLIEYNGTKADWKKIYNRKSFEYTYFTVNCTDGIIKKSR